MIYSRLFIKKKVQIPTVLSILIVGFLLFLLGRFFVTTSPPARAERKIVKKMQVTNVFPNQVVVFWQTDKKETGWVVFGEEKNQLSRIALDERDSEKDRKEYTNHYVILRNLNENSQYFFKPVSGNKLVEKANGDPFQFKTINKKTTVSNVKPAYGKIINKNTSPLENGVVLLFIDKAFPLSALSKATGEWLIPLNFAVDKSSNKPRTFSPDSIVKIEILSETGESSIVRTRISNLSPLPETIRVGRDYDILEVQDVLSAKTEQQKSSPFEIIFPKEKAVIPANNPLIKGTAGPNSEVLLTLSDRKSGTTARLRTNSTGEWKLNVSGQLSAGSYTLTVKTKDSGGKDLVRTRNFTIAKSGEKVLGEATPEATATLVPSPTQAATSAATITPSTTPPVTGGSFFYIALSSLMLILLGIGLLTVF